MSYDTWYGGTQFPSVPPFGTFLPLVAQFSDDVAYIGGGSTFGNGFTKRWYLCNPNGTVTQKADMTVAKYSGAGFASSTHCYVTCGVTEGYLNSPETYAYEVSGNTWSQKLTMPSFRYGCWGWQSSTKGYVVGGYTGGGGDYNKEVWEYSFDNDTWTQKTSYSGTALNLVSWFFIGDKGYFGTGVTWGNTPVKTFHEYNMTTDTWTQKADIGGDARSYGAGFSLRGNINKGYIGGGSGIFTFYEYNPTNNSWVQRANFPADRWGLVGWSSGTNGFLGGGRTNPNVTKYEIYRWDGYQFIMNRGFGLDRNRKFERRDSIRETL